ncbi:hypothetical protein TWF569_010571 [Orbilia oligospora]|uniref:Uncharacterized protein n=1 Tax=Orbilia oligospora TaxID=2813651 RepID=A0A7C8RBV4_ORBOL|nr:hypothetical protein TWF706_005101 [Orbilia oligospora]KAF3103233.1 hypothetical protein TWF103_007234 [Orbilia oligospora]KAF3148514.1 hypothetical protein TWF594_000925 [Orbilia oligospora]KAF3153960.1 hypothetical protein TWF751_004065 [Orbilia oligospora]KAF3154948.1 hypothetical protein TWF569_010571 [Orbilia oligospora]
MYKDESFRLDRKFKNLGAAAPNYTSFQAKKRRSPKTTLSVPRDPEILSLLELVLSAPDPASQIHRSDLN